MRRSWQKYGIFRFQSQFLWPNMTKSSWNQNSYLNIKLGEQLSLKAFIFLTILVKLYLVKMCPIFASSASNCLTRYKQILSECSLGCKNALNFTCLPMKFHNHGHTTVHCCNIHLTSLSLPRILWLLPKFSKVFYFGIDYHEKIYSMSIRKY